MANGLSLDQLAKNWRTIVAIFALIGFLATATISGKALLAMPTQLEKHMEQTQEQTEVLNKMLCIQIADRQRTDWTRCLTNAH